MYSRVSVTNDIPLERVYLTLEGQIIVSVERAARNRKQREFWIDIPHAVVSRLVDVKHELTSGWR
jgi:hypothetical protein